MIGLEWAANSTFTSMCLNNPAIKFKYEDLLCPEGTILLLDKGDIGSGDKTEFG